MSEDNDIDALIDVIPLQEDTARIANQILNEKDVDKVKDLTALFNLNQRKKNIIRLMKFNDLLDAVSDQMAIRLEQSPGSFDNSELLDCVGVIQSTIERTQKSIDMISDTPAIQVNTQNNVNVNIGDTLSRESREKVVSAIRGIMDKLNSMNAPNIDFHDASNNDTN